MRVEEYSAFWATLLLIPNALSRGIRREIMDRTRRTFREGLLAGIVITISFVLLGSAAGLVRTHPGHLAQENETTAIWTLKNIFSAQEQFRDSAVVDADGDRRGEYGFFGEMSGGAALRTTGIRIPVSVLGREFRSVDVAGTVWHSGYFFRVFLAARGGHGVVEWGAPLAGWPERDVTDEWDMPVDADLAELYWCCYAWPEQYGESGRRTFFINQAGHIRAVDDARYSGEDGPSAGAAFSTGVRDGIIGDSRDLLTGKEANPWKILRQPRRP